MKTFKGSTSDDVFAFLEDKILEIDNWLLCKRHPSE